MESSELSTHCLINLEAKETYLCFTPFPLFIRVNIMPNNGDRARENPETYLQITAFHKP